MPGRTIRSLLSRLPLVLIATALSLFAPAPVAAAGQPAAVDEYSFGPAGIRDAAVPNVQVELEQGARSDRPPPASLGVVGENAVAESQLEAIGPALGGAALALLAVAVAAGVASARQASRDSLP